MNYLEKLADAIRANIPSEKLPSENVDDLLLSYALLAESKGSRVSNRDVHNAWVAWMTEIDPLHESLVPYDELDPEVQREDSVFTNAIKSALAHMPDD